MNTRKTYVKPRIDQTEVKLEDTILTVSIDTGTGSSTPLIIEEQELTSTTDWMIE